MDCYEAVCKLCNLKFLLPSEDHYNHRSEIEKHVKLLKYNDKILVQKLGIHFECDTKPGSWQKKAEYIIKINKLYMKIFMSGDQFTHIEMSLENEIIVDLFQILEFLDSIKNKLLENREKKEVEFQHPLIENKDIIKNQVDTKYTIMNEFVIQELEKEFKSLKLPQKFQKDFFRVLNFFGNKIVYNNNHKEFLQDYVEDWYGKNKDLSRKDMETKCFHPFMREKLKDEFGEEIIDTPDEARGHIDLKLSFTIPIELKVLKDKKGRKKEDNKNALELLEKQYITQIKSEIINSRVGFLVGLDFRQKIDRDLTIMLNSEYVRFKWISYPKSKGLIIIFVFLANKKTPSE